ncbi:copper resistance CopC family protein [Sulfitobacter sabulilitoris]|uniref:Copper resistance protein CopC n=1 Tax=Sulfitobacter sabulilitoris TaxID=2562655 RepID=A0A5S3PBV2_9RHOB|nr:copper resistance CopC family protein [Sulfitobacter sabulilitoris]TMM51176.1 copper resistance protein CopC [Sulfitobacter sabulilitoris]
MKHHFLAAALSLLATGVLAHSPLKATTPADGAVAGAVPTEVTMTFMRDIRLTRVQATHADHDPVDLDLGDQTSFATGFALPLEGMGPGTYVIEWRGLGDDGHPLTGRFGFTVE